MARGYSAYLNVQTIALKGRPLEGAALSKAARLLEQARHRPDDPGALADALEFNTKLWTIFQADLSDPDNDLPKPLRNDLLRLCRFMDRATRRALGRKGAARALRAMIDVNRNLALGLMND